MSERRQIFRQAALDRLASSEHLDQPMRLVGGAGWLVLLALGVAILGAILWSATATAPVKVKARGILIAAGGLDQIVASVPGRLLTLDIRPGDAVAVGDLVAQVEQGELRRELETARARLEDARAQFRELEVFHRDKEARERLLETERLGTIAQTRRLLEERLVLLDKKHASVSKLVEKRVITDDELIEVQLGLSDVRERLAELDDEQKAIALRKEERAGEDKLTMLEKRLRIQESERSVERLEARLGEQGRLLSAHAGRVLEVMVGAGDVVQPGETLATVAPVGGAREHLVAFAYVKPTDGKRVRPGMDVEVLPSAFRPEEFGYLRGRVEQVSELPATRAGMRRLLKNEQLVQDLTTAGAPFQVRVALLEDAATPSGYQWSSSRGPDARINAGMLIEARVIVDRERLLILAVPQVERLGTLGGSR
ncbi:NHLP bacteriocin system secretion protein [Thiorhodococcus mannitoliphagus]|uniref:NHLP bacteriocin system secretion protein n=1 Tax=Thiorhodococcus mannitoliphagus TaxID=329406 RepID=A0A6P1DNA8_9GAMM|nr:NHLP bacteriocin system secretion protein [Thiorhodococcus mannitoliphagus]NEX19727.1 NHLP bacteriocin system secretion protein [Thiorhodococcus mannitoliphagus]